MITMEAEQRTLFAVYKSLFENHPDACYAFDTVGNFILVNHACEKMFGYTVEEFLEMTYDAFFYEKDLDSAIEYIESTLNGNQEVFDMRVRHKDGSPLDLHITIVPIIVDAKVQGIIGMAKNVSEQILTQKELISSKNQLQNIFNSLDVCFWSRDIILDQFVISSSCEKIYGYSEQFFIADPSFWRKIIHPHDLDAVIANLERIKAEESIKQEYRIIHKNGDVKWISDHTLPVFNETGQLIRMDGQITDINQRKIAEEKLQFMAFHDSLTGLPNRRLFQNKLDEALVNASEKYKVVVMYLDLDRFKYINDTLGHTMGDQLLEIVAKRLKSCLRDGDLISRQGGDEFAILLNKVVKMDAITTIAKKILKVIIQPIKLENHEYILTTSIGVSIYPTHGKDSLTLIKQADQAMYIAKENGKNNYKFYHSNITNLLSRKVIVEQKLHKALKNEEISLYYQPIVDVGMGSICGVEALVRWNESELGYMPPSEFIPIAEESGLMFSIGEWILRNSCIQNKLWQNEGFSPIYVSVNISASQFKHENFVQLVKQILEETGLEPRYLRLEITESTAMTNVSEMIRKLEQLHSVGVRLSIDDFGTGYSSLSYLKKFKNSTLKIDPSFIKDINMDPDQEAIINGIVAMAKSLRMGVVAEGVEMRHQVEYLKSIGCNQMQGYFFSEPLPSDDVKELFNKPVYTLTHC
jgi:diguanylate cyclase (GGDEF)-like protein/PAS domain S-box-containing protein